MSDVAVQLDMEFASDAAPGIFAQAARPICCSIVANIGQLQHVLAEALAHRIFLTAGAWRGTGDRITKCLAEIRHELPPERQQCGGGDGQHRQRRDTIRKFSLDETTPR